MSLTGINNLSYLTYGAIGLTGIILAVATAYDRADGEPPLPEAAPLFTEPIVPDMPALPSFSSEPSSEPGPLADLLGSSESNEESSILPDVFGSDEPKNEESNGMPASGGKKKKRRTKKSKKSKKSKAEKKHRKTKHKQTK